MKQQEATESMDYMLWFTANEVFRLPYLLNSRCLSISTNLSSNGNIPTLKMVFLELWSEEGLINFVKHLRKTGTYLFHGILFVAFWSIHFAYSMNRSNFIAPMSVLTKTVKGKQSRLFLCCPRDGRYSVFCINVVFIT